MTPWQRKVGWPRGLVGGCHRAQAAGLRSFLPLAWGSDQTSWPVEEGLTDACTLLDSKQKKEPLRISPTDVRPPNK